MKNGKKIYYILIDTEGIGSIQQDQTYDAKIFSLTLLLSSYFIYNSMGMIDILFHNLHLFQCRSKMR